MYWAWLDLIDPRSSYEIRFLFCLGAYSNDMGLTRGPLVTMMSSLSTPGPRSEWWWPDWGGVMSHPLQLPQPGYSTPGSHHPFNYVYFQFAADVCNMQTTTGNSRVYIHQKIYLSHKLTNIQKLAPSRPQALINTPPMLANDQLSEPPPIMPMLLLTAPSMSPDLGLILGHPVSTGYKKEN